MLAVVVVPPGVTPEPPQALEDLGVAEKALTTQPAHLLEPQTQVAVEVVGEILPVALVVLVS